MDLNIWLKNIDKISLNSKSNDYKTKKIFKSVLKWIVKTEYRGGCHDTSAVIHMLLCEQGIESELCIGEVKISDESFFDHSWIRVEGLVFDASVCMPNIGGYAFPPVFASKNLHTLDTPEINYGAKSPVGFDSAAKFVSSVDLSDYSLAHPNDPEKLWNIAKLLAKESGMKVSSNRFKNKYGSVKRTVVIGREL